MPNLGGFAKYLGLLSLGKGIIDKVVLQRLLVGVAGVIGLSVIAAMLIGTIVLGVFAALYYALLTYTPIHQVGALGIVVALIIALAAFTVYKIVQYSKKISTFSAMLLQPSSPVTPVTNIVNAFMNGLKQRHQEERKSNKTESKTKIFPRGVKK